LKNFFGLVVILLIVVFILLAAISSVSKGAGFEYAMLTCKGKSSVMYEERVNPRPGKCHKHKPLKCHRHHKKPPLEG